MLSSSPSVNCGFSIHPFLYRQEVLCVSRCYIWFRKQSPLEAKFQYFAMAEDVSISLESP